jgi:predicted PurR-regulated permease PerM
MIRGRLRHRGQGQPPHAEDDFVEFDAGGLTRVFATPSWLRDLGLTSWLLVGVALLLVGGVWLASLTQTIVIPVIAAGMVAAVASPLVAWGARHRLPRALSAALLLLLIVVTAAVVVVLVIAGVTSQSGDITSHLAGAKSTITSWLKDLGVNADSAKKAVKDASSTSTDSVETLLDGIGTGIKTLSSLVFFLSLTVLSLFFLLKDGPTIRAWAERHMGVPDPVAHAISRRSLQSLRGYFLGVSIVAAFNAVVIGVGALVLGVPLPGTIAVITFFAAFVPYLGAWTAGGFAVLVALGGAGTDAAIAMGVIVLLANGVLQQLVQPFAYGAALGIHPLAVLIVTIGAGALFGTVGLVLAAPVTSAVVRISSDLSRAHTQEEQDAPGDEAPADEAPGTAPA